ncbi:MAG: response regulator, partial [Bacteroidales bacterium]
QMVFATTNYILANRDELVYRLEGFSEEWSNLRDQNSIAFTNLSPGNYTLVIKNSDVSPIPVRKEMKIRVLPPFYRTGVAYGVYLLLVLIASWLIIRAYKAKVRLEESLKYEQKHLQDIETLNQAKLRFFTNISHEFRTPLTIIIGQIENLLHQQVFTPAIYKKVLNVYQNSLQLRGLISELLDFRKQEQGHMQLKVREQDIVGFLQENFLLFSEYAESLDIRFSFEKEIDSLHVWYDQRQLQKVVNNLLSNAFKHCKANDRIQLRVYADAVFVYFEVVDSGTGIPKEEVEKIFERFYQISHQSENILGTGIGLALTKGIIDLHHGDIRVESEPARETVFRVSLKLGKQHFQPEQIDSEKVVEEADVIFPDELFLKYEKPEVQPELPVVREGTVMLIVEDNTSLRDMLSSIFGVFYTVVTAADGVEALEKVEEQQPSIILSDVMMPRMNGTELCKRIKGNMETCHIPVVLLTARIAIEHNLEGLGVGADDYITKPFNTETLISRCNNLVNGRILLQEKFSGQFATTPQMLATNALDKEFLDKATVVIDKYLSDPEFNVNLFSREMGIARTKLFMKIKAITGQTPNDFISTIRLKRGASLLVNHPEMSVTEVAELTGFGSPRYFSKCFKDYFKITPLMYRKGENVQN